jgi:hypothetical protein
MEVIRTRLISIEIENYEYKDYIPYAELDKYLDLVVVSNAIKESKLDPPKQDEIIQTILVGGKRVFAILIRINCLEAIVRFIERDQLQLHPLDAKLPFSEPILIAILGETPGNSFYRKQWSFVAPLFRGDLSHRILDKPTILPFNGNRKIGEGAFGAVYEVTIDARHQVDAAGAQLPSVWNTYCKVNAFHI